MARTPAAPTVRLLPSMTGKSSVDAWQRATDTVRTTGRDEMAAKADDGDREPNAPVAGDESGTGWPATGEAEAPGLDAYQPSRGGRATAELPARAPSKQPS